MMIKLLMCLLFCLPSLAVAQTSGRPSGTYALVCRQGHNTERAELYSFFKARRTSELRFFQPAGIESAENTQREILEKLSGFPLLKRAVEESLIEVRSQWGLRSWETPQEFIMSNVPPLYREESHCHVELIAESGRTGHGPVIIARHVYLAMSYTEQCAAQIEHAILRVLLRSHAESQRHHLEALSQTITVLLFGTPQFVQKLYEKTLIAEFALGRGL